MVTGRVAAFFAGAMVLASALPGVAQDRREYDPRIEKWAAERISGKLGELRGSFALDEGVDAATVHDAFSKPPPKPKRLSPIFVLPKRASEQLPPIVMRIRSRSADS
jgi:hypothetical protein